MDDVMRTKPSNLYVGQPLNVAMARITSAYAFSVLKGIVGAVLTVAGSRRSSGHSGWPDWIRRRRSKSSMTCAGHSPAAIATSMRTTRYRLRWLRSCGWFSRTWPHAATSVTTARERACGPVVPRGRLALAQVMRTRDAAKQHPGLPSGGRRGKYLASRPVTTLLGGCSKIRAIEKSKIAVWLCK